MSEQLLRQYIALTTVTFPNETTKEAVLYFGAPSSEAAGIILADEQERHRHRRGYPLDAIYGVWRYKEVGEPVPASGYASAIPRDDQDSDGARCADVGAEVPAQAMRAAGEADND